MSSTNVDLGTSARMRSLNDQLAGIAALDSTVLIMGETGTGKGWVARRIHDRSPRRGKPFVEVSCCGMDAPLLESTLFGYQDGTPSERPGSADGAFGRAHGGTILLDEVGDLPLELQPRLLKVLERGTYRRVGGTTEHPVDVRVITSSKDGLEELVKQGEFREDLYYRLAVLPLELPPLRDRAPEDLAWLANQILADLRRTLGGGPGAIAEDAMAHLNRHDWPGNIRELRNVLERTLILAGDTDVIREEHLPPEIQASGTSEEVGEPMTLEEIERMHVSRVLERTEGNRSQAARILGISRAALYDKLDRYGLRKVGR